MIVIDAPHFNAAVALRDFTVVRAAPILRYMVGWNVKRVVDYCHQKGWSSAMKLKEAAESNRLKLVEQLYDEWKGYYCVLILVRDSDGWPARWDERHPGSRMSRKAAVHWHNPDMNNYCLMLRLPGDPGYRAL